MNGSKTETEHMRAKPNSSNDPSSPRTDVDEAAEDTILKRTLVRIDLSVFNELAAMIDQPASSAGFERLVNAPALWNEDAHPLPTKRAADPNPTGAELGMMQLWKAGFLSRGLN